MNAPAHLTGHFRRPRFFAFRRRAPPDIKNPNPIIHPPDKGTPPDGAALLFRGAAP